MNKKIIYGILGILFLVTLFLFIKTNDKKDSKQSNKTESNTNESTQTSSNSEFSSFPDAPAPSAEDGEADTEKLWPHLSKKVDVEKKREEVKKEWVDFAQKYPKNFYIPNEIKAPLTEAESQDIRKQLDIVSKLDSKFSVFEANSKRLEVGKVPQIPSKPDVTPEEQRVYISYKLRELQSRIELIEYSIDSKAINGDQLTIARRDIETWKKELTKLQDVEKQIPKT